MKIKRLVSAFAALAMTVSAFAGLATTASAAEVLLNKDASDQTAGTLIVTSNGGASATLDEFTVTGGNSANAEIYVFSGSQYRKTNDGNNGIVNKLAHGEDSNNYYLLLSNSIASRDGNVKIVAAKEANEYGKLSLSFAMPTYQGASNKVRNNHTAEVNLGDIASIGLVSTERTATSPIALTVSAGKGAGKLSSSDSTSITTDSYKWIDAVLYFNLKDGDNNKGTAKLVLTIDDANYTYYFTDVTVASIQNIILTVKEVNNDWAMGNIAFDDVKLETLDEAPDTVLQAADVKYTVKWVDGDGKEIKTADTRTGKEGTSVSAEADDLKDITYDGKKYIYESGNDSITLSSNGTNVITLVFREAETYTVKITATFGEEGADGSEVLVSDVNVYERDSYTYGYPKYKQYNGKWYTVAQGYFDSDQWYKYVNNSVTTDSGIDNITIPYKTVLETDVVYFGEVEDILGVGNSGAADKRYSSAAAVKSASGTIPVELPAGIYKITIGARNASSSGVQTAYLSGGVTEGEVSADLAVNSTTAIFRDYAVATPSKLSFRTNGNNFEADYILIEKTAPYVEFETLAQAKGDGTNVQLNFVASPKYEGEATITNYGFWFINIDEDDIKIGDIEVSGDEPIASGESFYYTTASISYGTAKSVGFYAIPWVKFGEAVAGIAKDAFTYDGDLDTGNEVVSNGGTKYVAE